MTKEESISVIAEIKGLLTKRDWFATDGTMGNPDGSNTDTHIKMTRILWDKDELGGEESWDIYFDEDDGYITIEYEDFDIGPSLFEFIDETNLEKGKLNKEYRSLFTRKPGYGKNLVKFLKGGRE